MNDKGSKLFYEVLDVLNKKKMSIQNYSITNRRLFFYVFSDIVFN